MFEAADVIENALDIPIDSADNLIFDDCRRLTGAGLLWHRAGAIIDIFSNDFNHDILIEIWNFQARRMMDAVGWQDQYITVRKFDGGVNLAISAPMDQLYSAIFVAKSAWHFCAAQLLNKKSGDFHQMVNDIKSVMSREANPKLIALIAAANKHGVDILCDDDIISIGHGIYSQSFAAAELPNIDDIDWPVIKDIPIAMITGTNGKTTTTRLAAAIAKASGLCAGLTSTDYVSVGDDIIDHGDYSGPGGGRMLLRDRRLEIAYLEVARGGILRRGLASNKITAAVVLNVAADHLGQFGVNSVEDLATAKFAVHHCVKKTGLNDNGILILNADDDYIIAEAAKVNHKNICWISLNHDAPQITAAINYNKICAFYDGQWLIYFDGAKSIKIIKANDIPISLNGAAKYNILNSLAALCLSRSMAIDDQAIHKGLSNFKNNPQDNPGRCNQFMVNGAKIFVDFAHNPHSVAAITSAMAAMPAKRRFILLSHAGDRSDQDIIDVTKSALAFKPDHVIAAELPDYLRGREIGEVTKLITDTCIKLGMSKDNITIASNPAVGVGKIITELQAGDMALLLVLSHRDQIFKIIKNASAT